MAVGFALPSAASAESGYTVTFDSTEVFKGLCIDTACGTRTLEYQASVPLMHYPGGFESTGLPFGGSASGSYAQASGSVSYCPSPPGAGISKTISGTGAPVFAFFNPAPGGGGTVWVEVQESSVQEPTETYETEPCGGGQPSAPYQWDNWLQQFDTFHGGLGVDLAGDTIYAYRMTLTPGSGDTVGTFTSNSVFNQSFAQETDSLNVTVTGPPPPPPLQITTTSLPSGALNSPYTTTLQPGGGTIYLNATGGTTPYTWSLADGSGPLPDGLTLDPSSGAITGTPTQDGTFNFSVQVQDSSDPALTATKALSIEVDDMAVTSVTTSHNGQTDVSAEGGYNGALTATVTGVGFTTGGIPDNQCSPSVSFNVPGKPSLPATVLGTPGDTQLQVSTPAIPPDDLSGGEAFADVIVACGGHQTAVVPVDIFTYVPPTVTSVQPGNGSTSSKTSVTVHGIGLAGANTAVLYPTPANPSLPPVSFAATPSGDDTVTFTALSAESLYLGGPAFFDTLVQVPFVLAPATDPAQSAVNSPADDFDYTSPDFIVNTTSDAPETARNDGVCDTGTVLTVDGIQVPACSLRAAIQEANAFQSHIPSIAFDIPGGGVPKIEVATTLPRVVSPMTIDGTTQPGGQVEIDNSCPQCNAGPNRDSFDQQYPGLYVGNVEGEAGNVTVRGLVINGFQSGIVLDDVGGDTVQDDVIHGPGTSGTSDFCGVPAIDGFDTSFIPTLAGIVVYSAHNQIGGSGQGDGNQITEQDGNCGILVLDREPDGGTRAANDNQIQGNSISGGELFGVLVDGGQGNTIGGAISGAGNSVSGVGREDGVDIDTVTLPATDVDARDEPSGDVVQGNQVSGGPLAIRISGSSNTVGGTAPGAGNNITDGNGGIEVAGTGNVVQSNTIAGSIIHPAFGIWLNGASGSTIGGSSDQAGNVITGITPGKGTSGDPHGGVYVSSASISGSTTPSDNNTIEHNTITNGGDGVVVAGGKHDAIGSNVLSNDQPLAIDLGDDGPTANQNETSGLPGGANDGQNFPVVTTASVSGSTVSVTGFLHSVANQSYTLEFYISQSCDPSGRGDGQYRLGTRTVQTDGSGVANFTFTDLDGSGAAGALGGYVSATATSSQNDTSEMSFCRSQLAPGETLGNPTTLSYSASEGLTATNVPGLPAGSSLSIPAFALPDGTTVNVYPVQNSNPLQSQLPDGQGYVLGFAVGWTAPDGSSPATQGQLGAVTVTINDPAINLGDTVYYWTPGGLQKATATVIHGQAVIMFTTDPLFVIASPAGSGGNGGSGGGGSGSGGGGGVTLGGGGSNFAPAPTIDQSCQASAISSHAATLTAEVNPEGQATSAFFQYGTNIAYDQQTGSQQVGSGTQDHQVSARLSGLSAGTSYHCRLVATNPAGTTYSADKVFRIPAAGSPPPPQPQRANPHLHLQTLGAPSAGGCTVKLRAAHAASARSQNCEETVTITGTIDPRANAETIALLLQGAGRDVRSVVGRIHAGRFTFTLRLPLPASAGKQAWTFAITYAGDHILLPASVSGGFTLKREPIRRVVAGTTGAANHSWPDRCSRGRPRRGAGRNLFRVGRAPQLPERPLALGRGVG